MKIGYARVSTIDQNVALQEDALQQAGCEKIITGSPRLTRSAARVALRPGLSQVRNLLRSGDTLVVWRLDRLGRSLKDLIAWTNYLDEEGVGLVSLQETINTTTPTGKLVFHLFGVLAEFERNLIRERTMAGLSAARARGRQGGRPKALSLEKRQLLRKLYEDKNYSVKAICQMLGISKPTLYKYLSLPA